MADSFDKVVQALQAHHTERAGEENGPHYVSDENRQAAVAAHELFCILLSGGFTETQACKVIAARMVMDEED